MSIIVATLKTPPMPFRLTFTNLRSYIFTATFVAMSIALPYVCHQFHLAGPTYLPMHIFVLMAGLLFGWRAGLLVGGLSPLVSFAISGMPTLAVLPQIVAELSAYGVIAGLLREKYHFRMFWSLLGAMIGGRLFLLAVTSLLFVIGGHISSPFGVEANPLLALWSVVEKGWPGIAIQLSLLPVLVWLAERFLRNRDSQNEQRHV